MRLTATTAFGLSLLVIAAANVVACAPSEEESMDDSRQDVTGGTSAIESPVVYLFDGPRANTPKCAGALLGKRVAVTAKACAEDGLIVGRAADQDGKGTRAKITAVHVPESPDADIAVVELDRELGGSHAVITHAPLRDGYAINGVASAEGSGFLAPRKGEASSIVGRLTTETEMHSTLFPAKGSQVCAGDIGAPVCSSTGTKLAGFNIFGTCGLSGLVVGPDGVPNTPAKAANGSGRERPGKEAPVATNATAPSCSGAGWRVAQLGRYAEFLRKFAPAAFEPLVIDKPILRNFPYAPPGLWGYQSGGTVAECKIRTAKLDTVAAETEVKLAAKVSFANMQERAAPFGRFGIAPKSAPTQMRWFPARMATSTTTGAFEASFEGVVAAVHHGEYVVGFRASANGGEEWTQCDTDGIENGFSADKMLPLKVAAIDKPAETPDEVTHRDTPPSPSTEASNSDYSDPEPSGEADSEFSDSNDPSGDPTEEGEPIVGKKKKKKTSSDGCSVSPGGTTTRAGLPMMFGVLLGLAALIRRRR